MTSKEIIRSKWDGCYEIVSDQWGTRLSKTYDPEGMDLSSDELSEFELNPQFVRIPKTLLDRVISFFSVFSIESQVILIRRVDDLAVWDALVPRQQNTFGSTSSDKKDLISISTGEKYNDTPEGWVESGSIHSHPNMKAYWSSVDDKSELKWPGVHITVGGDWKNKNFTLCSSICIGGYRYVFSPNNLCEGDFTLLVQNDPEHHVKNFKFVYPNKNVTDYVTQKIYTTAPKTKDWWKTDNQIGLYDYADPFMVKDTYVSNKLKSFDKERNIEALKNAIDDYLIDGGNPDVLRQHINETVDEIFTWYNF